MAKTTLYSSLKEANKNQAIKMLVEKSTPNHDFFLMIILSIMMATLGLILNSVAIIIGSMLIAPILHPILSLSLGLNISDGTLIARSFYTILKSFLLAILFSLGLSVLFRGIDYELGSEIIQRAEPSLAYLAIAIIAGYAASYTLVKPEASEHITGIAVSVALIPPLAVVGIGLAKLNWDIASNAFLLFLVNIVGVIFASFINFSIINFYMKRRVVRESVKKEDRKMKKEKKKAKKEEIKEK